MWIDFAFFDHGYSSYLIQVRVHRNNRKQFKVRRTTGHSAVAATLSQLGDVKYKLSQISI